MDSARMIEARDFEALQRIMRALYDDTPMAGDRRRDLANAMFAILDRAIPIEETQP